jgi:hypothetical protein
LTSIIKGLQEKYGITINYDPDLLANYLVTSQALTDDLEADLTTALLGTNLEHIEIDGRWVIAKGEPKARTICGRLLNSNDEPLPFTNILVDRKVFTSDSLGDYRFISESTLNTVVEFSYLGYSPLRLPISHWRTGKCQDLRMRVDTSLALSEVVVYDYILKGITKSRVDNGLTINYQKLMSDFSSIQRDAFSTLQLLPGIKAIDDSAMGLYIHGASPSQNLVLWEEATLYDPGHLFGMISPINPQTIAEMKIYKDGADPYYDSRVGGIIDISAGDEIEKNWSLGLGQSLTTSHGFIKGPLYKDKVSISLAGRMSANRLFESPTITNYSGKVFQATKIEDEMADADDGILDADFNLDFADWNAKLIGQISPKTKVMASYMANTNSLFYFSKYEEDFFSAQDAIDYESEIASVSLSHNWSARSQTKIVWTYSNYMNTYEFNLEDAVSFDTIYGNSTVNNIRESGLKVVHSSQINDDHHLNLGVDANTKSVFFQFQDRVEEDENFEEENSSDFISPFFTYNWNAKHFDLSVSMRSSLFTAAEIWRHAPRLAINMPLTTSLSLNASAGRHYQFISQFETFYTNDLGINNSIWLLNEEDDDEFLNSDKYTLGLVYSKNNWQIDLNFFSNTTRDITTITSSIDRETFGDILGQSRALGMDLSISKKWDRLNLWINYSLNENLFDLGDEEVLTFNANQFQRHHLNFVTAYTLGQWTFSGVFHYSSGLPYTQAARIVEVDDGEDVFYEIEIDEFNGGQLPSISRIDLGIGYSKRLGSRLILDANLTMRNLLNRRNLFAREFLLIEDEYEMPEILTVNKRLLPRTPQISLTLRY